MAGSVIVHLQHNWPLVAAIVVLFALIAFALLAGIMPTNQGKVSRSREPTTYWRWLRWLGVLLALALVVLVGSYFLGPQ
jgi:predicted MFS family arabinose efflux permease